MMRDSGVDSPASEWQDIVGDERDTRDIKTLREGHGSIDVTRDYTFVAGSGLVLRKGDQPLGYILFEVHEKEDVPSSKSLLIQHFYTNNAARGIGSIVKIIKLLRKQAEKRECTSVMLRPVTPMEMHLVKRIGAKKEGRYYVIPIERLDINTILGKV